MKQLGGSGGMLPCKIFKLKSFEMATNVSKTVNDDAIFHCIN